MYHFAYGSNLCTEFVREYCPRATVVGRASLPNYRVEFRHYSETMGGGISTIMEAPGALVQGCLYEIPDRQLRKLDAVESVPDGLYRRDTFLVLDAGGNWQRADLYRVAAPTGPYLPSRSYVDLMLAGAKEHGLSSEYIDDLVELRDSLDGA